jgi:hypothetical protein
MPSKMKKCEDFRSGLIDTVAADSIPSNELRSHLDACASCRTTFAEEKQLFAAIDTGLRASANAEIPPSFLPRVRARIEDAPAAERGWTPFLIFAAASATIALTLFIASRPRRATANNEVSQQLSAPSRETPETPVRREATGKPSIVASDGSQHNLQRRISTQGRSGDSTRLEVLVPPDEREAFARFIDSQQVRDVVAIALVMPASSKKDEPMSVEPLEIAELEVKPLEALVSEVPDGTEDKQ